MYFSLCVWQILPASLTDGDQRWPTWSWQGALGASLEPACLLVTLSWTPQPRQLLTDNSPVAKVGGPVGHSLIYTLGLYTLKKLIVQNGSLGQASTLGQPWAVHGTSEQILDLVIDWEVGGVKLQYNNLTSLFSEIIRSWCSSCSLHADSHTQPPSTH